MPLDTWKPGQDLLAGFGPPPYVPPATWTPEHVIHRMVEAFEILIRCPGRVRPAGFKVAWPGYVHDLADVNAQTSNALVAGEGRWETDGERDDRLRRDAEAASRRIKLPPSAHELSVMEEALAWPLLLQAMPDRLALPKWAYRTARGRTSPRGAIVQAAAEASFIAAALRRKRIVVR